MNYSGVAPPPHFWGGDHIRNERENKEINSEIEGKGILRTTS